MSKENAPINISYLDKCGAASWNVNTTRYFTGKKMLFILKQIRY